MKFGVREICNVVFKAKTDSFLGNKHIKAGQPVLYIDTAKTSTLEGAATAVYANGGRGNTRLITWEGEKTLTFTVEDALLSPVGFAILSGAGLIPKKTLTQSNIHLTSIVALEANTTTIKLPLAESEYISPDIDVFVIQMDSTDGNDMGDIVWSGKVSGNEVKEITLTDGSNITAGTYFVDYYVKKDTVHELQIDAANFGGYYYVEADTLFRRESDGTDMPANLTFPKVKVQSNFTFNMAPTGDPSTFTFTMDAMPGNTYFNPEREVLCAIQVIDETKTNADFDTVFGGTMERAVADNTETQTISDLVG